MTNTELVQTLMSSLDDGDIAKARSLIADDFQISGPFPEALSREQWLGMHSTLKAAFPDWSFNLNKVEDRGHSAVAYYHITGTHKGALDLSAMGMSVIPATSKTIKLPAEHAEVNISDGKVTSMVVHGNEGGGMPGLLKQIGVNPPG